MANIGRDTNLRMNDTRSESADLFYFRSGSNEEISTTSTDVPETPTLKRTKEVQRNMAEGLSAHPHSFKFNLIPHLKNQLLSPINPSTDGNKSVDSTKNIDENVKALTPRKLQLTYGERNQYDRINDEESTLSQVEEPWSSHEGGMPSDATACTSVDTISNTENHNKTHDRTYDSFVTPRKPIKQVRNENLDAKRGIQQSFAHSENETNKNTKKRKLSFSCTPNRSVASEIDTTVESPIVTGSSTEVLPNVPLVFAGNNEDKVWYPELDEMLIKSFLKYREFKSNKVANNASSALKHTSQNKILSRMLHNKTGILRTAKQISSRLCRLSKLNRLSGTKPTKPTPQQLQYFQELDDLMTTPLNDLFSNSQVSSNATNSLYDPALDALLSSPINYEPGNIVPSSHKLTLKEFHMNYTGSNQMENHTFLKLNLQLESIESMSGLGSRYNISSKILRRLRDEAIPLWLVKHDVNLRVNHQQHFFTSTPKSAIGEAFHHFPLNLATGQFRAYMSIDIKCPRPESNVLHWNSFSQFFKGKNNDQKLAEVVDMVNGYRKVSDSSYSLQVPFMRQFFMGYFSYLVNGEGKVSENDDLRIYQVIYDNVDGTVDFNEENSAIKGYVVHEFNMRGISGKSTVEVVTIRDDETGGHETKGQEQDDNETIPALSSPIRDTPSSRENFTTPRRNDLQIDIKRANCVRGIAGPMTAPAFDTSNAHFPNHLQQFPNSGNIQYQIPMTAVPMDGPRPPLQQSQSAAHMNAWRSQGAGVNLVTGTCDQSICTNLVANTSNSQNMFGHPTPLSQGNYFNQVQQLPASVSLNQGGQNISINSQNTFHVPQNWNSQSGIIHQQQNNFQIQLDNNFSRQNQLSHAQESVLPNAPVSGININQPQLNMGFAASSTNKENINPKEIKFGPILEYDPSENTKRLHKTKKTSKQQFGTNCFPVNPPVNIYKPKGY